MLLLDSNHDLGDTHMLMLDEFVGADINDNLTSSSLPSSAASGGLFHPVHPIPPAENHVLYHHQPHYNPNLPTSGDADHVQHHPRQMSMQSHFAIDLSWSDARSSSAAARTVSSPDGLWFPHSPTFSVANDQLASHATRSSVTDILVKVYHTNLEDNLSSWSTAVTCPYRPRPPDCSRSVAHVNSSFYTRVRQMDAMLPRSGLAGLAESARINGRQGSDVLNKVVLAYASQWGGPSALQPGSLHQDLADSLQEVLHRTLWFDAQRALQNASESGCSFQIIFARLLFAFIQSPVSSIGANSEHAGSTLASAASSSKASPYPLGSAIVTSPDCVVQLETALRDLLTWRRRMYGTTCSLTDADHPAFLEHQSFLTDFNTFFWLGVICDTAASVISGRPLVITDDDCTVRLSESRSSPLSSMTTTLGQLSSPGSIAATQPEGTNFVSVWKAVLTNNIAGSIESSPLSESDMIEATIEAAIPLKVLLFRRVGIFKSLIDRGTVVGFKVDNAMQDVVLVFSLWEAKYGRFMDNCVDKYGIISRRIRSVHTTLMTHWHYGIMLFASKVEEQNKRILSQRDCRPSLAWDPKRMARRSASQVARLAQSCLKLSRVPLMPIDLDDDNQLTILNEPWCELMVRSLTMTVQVLLKFHNHINDSSGSIAQFGAVQACIEALEELGRHRYKTAKDIAYSLRLERDSMITQVV